MLFTIDKDLLLKLFKLALFVAVEKKSINNIIGSHILLEVQPDHIKLIATDLDVELIVQESVLSSAIQQSGKLVIPFRKISDICKAMSGIVELQISSNIAADQFKLKIDSIQGFFIVNCLSADLFPVVTVKEFDKSFRVNSNLLKDIISKVAFAMGDEDSRHFLNGIFLKISAQQITAVASDGHRLMVITKEDVDPLIQELTQEYTILLPRKSVLDLLKILAECTEELLVKILSGTNHVRLELNNIIYTTKLLNATFPPYQKLIPSQAENALTVSRELLKNGCLKAAALLGDRSQAIRLKFAKAQLILIAISQEGDLIQDHLPANLIGTELEICFNLKYLLDFLINSIGNEIMFKFNNASSGVLLQDLALHSDYVLMPIQV